MKRIEHDEGAFELKQCVKKETISKKGKNKYQERKIK